MKRLIISIVMAMVLLVLPVSGVFAASSDAVNVTATPIYLDIDVTPDITEALGNVAENSTTWAYVAVPADPLGANCTFTTTNNSSVNVNISIAATDFSGGNGWTLAGTVGVDTVVLKAGVDGDDWSAMVTVTNTAGDNPTFHSSLAASGGTEKWEFSLATGTFGDGVGKSTNITLLATAA